MGHLDPTNRGEYYPCDNIHPETCQAGDLAGKHGNITGSSFSSRYVHKSAETLVLKRILLIPCALTNDAFIAT